MILGTRHQRLRIASLAFTVIFFMLTAIAGALHSGAVLEEGLVLTEANLVAHGSIIYRDFNYMYGPAGLWIVAGAFKLFGSSLATERIVSLLFALATVMAVWLLGNRYSLWLATISAVVCTVGLSAQYESGGAYAWPWRFALCFSLFAIYLLTTDKYGRYKAPFIAGLLVSAAVLTRFDFAIGLFPVVVIYFFRMKCKQRLRLFFGLTVAPIGYLYQFVVAGPSATFYQLFINPQRELPGNALPIPPPTTYLAGWFDRLTSTLNKAPWFTSGVSDPVQLNIWFYFDILSYIVIATLLVYLFRTRPKGDKPMTLLSLFVFSVGLAPSTFQRSDVYHIMSLMIVLSVVLVLAFGEFMPFNRNWKGSMVIVTLAFVILTTLVAPNFYAAQWAFELDTEIGLASQPPFFVSNYGHEFIYGDKLSASQIQSMLNYVDSISKPNQTLFVGTSNLSRTPVNDVELYYLLPQLKPATYFIILYPDIALHHAKHMASDLKTADYVILDSKYKNWSEPNESVLYGPRNSMNVLANDFCIARKFGSFSVYVNRYKTALAPFVCKANSGS